MSKSGAHSISASASASASSYDPHSLPPNVKGLIQRYLAVSIPTITLTPELIDILDRSEVLIPSKIQVTMRWWKEDTSCSLSVFPKLNSPLPEAIERRQNLLRLRQKQEKELLLQQQIEQQYLQSQQQQQLNQLQQLQQQEAARIYQRKPDNNSQQGQLNAIDSTSLGVQPQSSSAQAQKGSAPKTSFLKRPWSGARFLNVFRRGKSKSKENKTVTPDTAAFQDESNLVLEDTDALYAAHVDAEINVPAEIEVKPLPSLPEAAYPITVAYPIRCSLESLYHYFLEMTSLTLEIQITPELSAITTVPRVIDLMRNINTTFSGVFPFSVVMQNDNPRLKSERLFMRRVVLGMVVFQAWFQDTSDVNDDTEDEDSISTNSVMARLAENGGVHHPHHHHSHHQRQNSLHDQYLRSAQRPEQQAVPVHPPHRVHTAMGHQRQHSQHGIERVQAPIIKPMAPTQRPIHPLDSQPQLQPQHQFHQYPHPHPQSHPQAHPQHHPHPHSHPHHHQQPQPRPLHTPQPHSFPHQQPASNQNRAHHRYNEQAYREPMEGQESYNPRLSVRYNDEIPQGDFHRASQRPYEDIDDPRFHNRGLRAQDQVHQQPRERHSHSVKYHSRQGTMDMGAGPARDQGRYAQVQSPLQEIPDERMHYGRHPHHQEFYRDDARPYHEDVSSHQRSRPRASATAAAIGRLDAVLQRGEDLLQGMRTSFALDPEEVRYRSARNIRSSAMREDPDSDRYLPYHEVLPYWPAKSRFSLEMSIPTAYITSRGLLKGSHRKKSPSPPPRDRPESRQRGDPNPRNQPPSTGLSENQRQKQRQTQASPLPHLSSKSQQQQQQQPKQQQQQGSEEQPTRRTPRLLRRSGKPIQFERLALRPDHERRAAQEDYGRLQYQSFQTEAAPTSAGPSAVPQGRFQPVDQTQQRLHRRQGSGWSSNEPRSPRKSKSYPPSTSSMEESRARRMHRRRLSSNDRLQLRMNPKAGDLLSYIPGLFPSRSTSALLVPEYHSSLEGSSISAGTSSSLSTDDDDDDRSRGFGFDPHMGGRQSRLQKRPHRSLHQHHSEYQQQPKRHQSSRLRQQRSAGEPTTSRKSGKDKDRSDRVHPQHFNFRASCQLQLTPDVMAACMVENISVEVWKLNNKRRTKIELGSAKLPLHKVLSQIMQKTATTSPSAAYGGQEDISYYQYRHPHQQSSGRQQRMGHPRAYDPRRKLSREGFREGWRLEPSVYEIRSRQGTVVGKLDADVWIHPRSRSDSMVSAAA